MRLLFMIVCASALCACGQPNAGNSTAIAEIHGKMEGPPVNELSSSALRAALDECLRYGKMDDVRVKYTATYCSAVMSAHMSEGYAKPAKSVVDPEINRFH